MKEKTYGVGRVVCPVLLATLSIFGLQELQAASGNGTLFATDDGSGNLIRVNTTTGVGTLVGFMAPGRFPALAVDPTTGIMYAGRGAGLPQLYTVNPTTGAATLVGNSGLGFAAISGMDFASDGTLFAAVNIAGDGGTGSDHLAIINKSTGAATVIGPFGTCTGVVVPSFGGGSCTIEGIEAIAFDLSGVLWGAKSARGRAGAPGLYLINPSTGAATFVRAIVDTQGRAPSGGIVSLQFRCDGVLFGGTATALGTANDGGRLVRINPATGLFSFVGTVAATTSGRSLAALAFQDPCAITVGIDIKPGSSPNSINPGSRGTIPVAVLSSAAFNAPASVNPLSLTFGRTGNENSLAFCNPGAEDVNGDGRPDVICHFHTQLTGFQPEDTVGVLKGKTLTGISITGSDSVRIVGRPD